MTNVQQSLNGNLSVDAQPTDPAVTQFPHLSAASKKNLLTNEEAAAYVGLTSRTLDVWRCNKRHAIPYIKVGRLVKYRQADLDAWLASRTVSDVAA